MFGFVRRLSLTVLCAILGGSAAVSQAVRSGEPTSPGCPPIHLRATARFRDGSPVSGLDVSDFIVRFPKGSGTVLAVDSGAPRKPASPFTNILFVVPPYSELSDTTYRPLLRRLARADNFRFNMAVLRPDGEVTPFTDDFQHAEAAMREASTANKVVTREIWPSKELSAFDVLRKLPGRHIVFRLLVPDLDRPKRMQAVFRNDSTMEGIAQYDGAQVYQLADPVDIRLAIPSGDASSSHPLDEVDADGRFDQQIRGRLAEEQQNKIWLQRRMGTASGGRSESSIQTLVEELIADASGSYDLTVQGRFTCRVGAMYPVRVAAARPDVMIYAPIEIQEIPSALPPSTSGRGPDMSLLPNRHPERLP